MPDPRTDRRRCRLQRRPFVAAGTCPAVVVARSDSTCPVVGVVGRTDPVEVHSPGPEEVHSPGLAAGMDSASRSNLGCQSLGYCSSPEAAFGQVGRVGHDERPGGKKAVLRPAMVSVEACSRNPNGVRRRMAQHRVEECIVLLLERQTYVFLRHGDGAFGDGWGGGMMDFLSCKEAFS
jgi:hypothetical protein